MKNVYINLKNIIKNNYLYTFFKKNLCLTSFVIISLVFGTIFIHITPPFWGVDESSQFNRAYQSSEGVFKAVRLTKVYGVQDYGGYIPTTVVNLENYALSNLAQAESGHLSNNNKQLQNINTYNKLESLKINSAKTLTSFVNTAAYSVFSYIPSSLGILIARTLNLSVEDSLLLARTCALIFYIIIIGYAIYVLRNFKAKWVIFVIALLPMTLYQVSIVNADTMTNAIALLITALFIKTLLIKNKEKLNRLELIIYILAIILMPILKSTYIFLSFLILLSPTVSLGLQKLGKQLKYSVITIALLIFGAWTYEVKNVANSIGLMMPGVSSTNLPNAGNQLKYLLDTPLEFIKLVAKGVILSNYGYSSSLLGNLGYTVVIPSLAQLFSLLSLFIVTFFIDPIKNKWSKIYLYLIVLIGSLTIFGVLYLTFDPVKSPSIFGIQNRYFIPYLGLLLVAIGGTIANKFNKINPKLYLFSQKLIISLVILSLLISAIKFYYIVI